MCYSQSGKTFKGVPPCTPHPPQNGMIVQRLKRLYNDDFVFVSCGSLCKVEENNLKKKNVWSKSTWDPSGLEALQ